MSRAGSRARFAVSRWKDIVFDIPKGVAARVTIVLHTKTRAQVKALALPGLGWTVRASDVNPTVTYFSRTLILLERNRIQYVRIRASGRKPV